MVLPDWVPQYGGMAALAGVGSVARGKQWFGQDGRFMWAKFLSEAATAIGLGVVIVAAGEYWHIDARVLSGLCVGAGWLGPAAVSELVLEKLGVKK